MTNEGSYSDQVWSDIDQANSFPEKRPILAHYTSVQTVESILKNDELWLSHPMLMNDHQEMGWALNEGRISLITHDRMEESCGDETRYQELMEAFEYHYWKFTNQDFHNVFVSCFCTHEADNKDGLLSMWRAYGANGGGVALVFDTSKLKAEDEESPLLLMPVIYASDEDRRAWIRNKVDELSEFIKKQNPPHDDLGVIAYHFLERIKVFALCSKHNGFAEEREWRLIYLADRDEDKTYAPMISYAMTERGIQQKLKLKIGASSVKEKIDLEDLICSVILGPTVGAPLSQRAMSLMFEKLGKKALVSRIQASSTPFRP